MIDSHSVFVFFLLTLIYMTCCRNNSALKMMFSSIHTRSVEIVSLYKGLTWPKTPQKVEYLWISTNNWKAQKALTITWTVIRFHTSNFEIWFQIGVSRVINAETTQLILYGAIQRRRGNESTCKHNFVIRSMCSDVSFESTCMQHENDNDALCDRKHFWKLFLNNKNQWFVKFFMFLCFCIYN